MEENNKFINHYNACHSLSSEVSFSDSGVDLNAEWNNVIDLFQELKGLLNTCKKEVKYSVDFVEKVKHSNSESKMEWNNLQYGISNELVSFESTHRRSDLRSKSSNLIDLITKSKNINIKDSNKVRNPNYLDATKIIQEIQEDHVFSEAIPGQVLKTCGPSIPCFVEKTNVNKQNRFLTEVENFILTNSSQCDNPRTVIDKSSGQLLSSGNQSKSSHLNNNFRREPSLNQYHLNADSSDISKLNKSNPNVFKSKSKGINLNPQLVLKRWKSLDSISNEVKMIASDHHYHYEHGLNNGKISTFPKPSTKNTENSIPNDIDVNSFQKLSKTQCSVAQNVPSMTHSQQFQTALPLSFGNHSNQTSLHHHQEQSCKIHNSPNCSPINMQVIEMNNPDYILLKYNCYCDKHPCEPIYKVVKLDNRSPQSTYCSPNLKFINKFCSNSAKLLTKTNELNMSKHALKEAKQCQTSNCEIEATDEYNKNESLVNRMIMTNKSIKNENRTLINVRSHYSGNYENKLDYSKGIEKIPVKPLKEEIYFYSSSPESEGIPTSYQLQNASFTVGDTHVTSGQGKEKSVARFETLGVDHFLRPESNKMSHIKAAYVSPSVDIPLEDTPYKLPCKRSSELLLKSILKKKQASNTQVGLPISGELPTAYDLNQRRQNMKEKNQTLSLPQVKQDSNFHEDCIQSFKSNILKINEARFIPQHSNRNVFNKQVSFEIEKAENKKQDNSEMILLNCETNDQPTSQDGIKCLSKIDNNNLNVQSSRRKLDSISHETVVQFNRSNIHNLNLLEDTYHVTDNTLKEQSKFTIKREKHDYCSDKNLLKCNKMNNTPAFPNNINVEHSYNRRGSQSNYKISEIDFNANPNNRMTDGKGFNYSFCNKKKLKVVKRPERNGPCKSILKSKTVNAVSDKTKKRKSLYHPIQTKIKKFPYKLNYEIYEQLKKFNHLKLNNSSNNPPENQCMKYNKVKPKPREFHSNSYVEYSSIPVFTLLADKKVHKQIQINAPNLLNTKSTQTLINSNNPSSVREKPEGNQNINHCTTLKIYDCSKIFVPPGNDDSYVYYLIKSQNDDFNQNTAESSVPCHQFHVHKRSRKHVGQSCHMSNISEGYENNDIERRNSDSRLFVRPKRNNSSESEDFSEFYMKDYWVKHSSVQFEPESCQNDFKGKWDIEPSVLECINNNGETFASSLIRKKFCCDNSIFNYRTTHRNKQGNNINPGMKGHQNYLIKDAHSNWPMKCHAENNINDDKLISLGGLSSDLLDKYFSNKSKPKLSYFKEYKNKLLNNTPVELSRKNLPHKKKRRAASLILVESKNSNNFNCNNDYESTKYSIGERNGKLALKIKKWKSVNHNSLISYKKVNNYNDSKRKASNFNQGLIYESSQSQKMINKPFHSIVKTNFVKADLTLSKTTIREYSSALSKLSFSLEDQLGRVILALSEADCNRNNNFSMERNILKQSNTKEFDFKRGVTNAEKHQRLNYDEVLNPVFLRKKEDCINNKPLTNTNTKLGLDQNTLRFVQDALSRLHSQIDMHMIEEVTDKIAVNNSPEEREIGNIKKEIVKIKKVKFLLEELISDIQNQLKVDGELRVVCEKLKSDFKKLSPQEACTVQSKIINNSVKKSTHLNTKEDEEDLDKERSKLSLQSKLDQIREILKEQLTRGKIAKPDAGNGNDNVEINYNLPFQRDPSSKKNKIFLK